MSLSLMYITNDPTIALIAEKAGVNRIFVDLETLGKEERQGHIDSIKSHHTIADVKKIRNTITTAELLVRVNPLNETSKDEIDKVIENGADYVMLPMWKTASDAKTFIDYVGGRAKVMLLLETKEAASVIEEVVTLKGIDEILIGLNDLHLSLKRKFMFELLADGTVEDICLKIKKAGIPYGFGGIGRIGYGQLHAEHILSEHYRLGSSMVILSRSFCDIKYENDLEVVKKKFNIGIKTIRAYEKMYSEFDEDMFAENHEIVKLDVKKIVEKIEEKS